MLKIVQITVLVAATLTLTACAATSPPPALAPVAETGNATLGFAYARQMCGSCHALGAGEMRSPNARARPFAAIANTPGLTRTALNAWLHSSHTNMPDLIVEPERVDDLHAYLLRLRRRP
jgi:mono/diheme cytochrome c family protein